MDLKIELFPTEKIGAIVEATQKKWLIENLWLESACGIIGGQAKCCKSWLGLDMVVSVASGTPCLNKFAIGEIGPALVFMAEDRDIEVRERVAGIVTNRGLNLNELNLHLITVPSLRLDSELDQKRLDATIAAIAPRIVLLDPLVRLHRLDENSAREISGLLGFLRELQRRHKIALVLTHHSSKRAGIRPGQGLRGTSDLHAFGDSNIYMSRKGNAIEIAVEHRSAASIDPFCIHLVSNPAVHLQIANDNAGTKSAEKLTLQVINILKKTQSPLPRQQLRDILKINNQKLGNTLNELKTQKIITITSQGLCLVE